MPLGDVAFCDQGDTKVIKIAQFEFMYIFFAQYIIYSTIATSFDFTKTALSHDERSAVLSTLVNNNYPERLDGRSDFFSIRSSVKFGYTRLLMVFGLFVLVVWICMRNRQLRSPNYISTVIMNPYGDSTSADTPHATSSDVGRTQEKEMDVLINEAIVVVNRSDDEVGSGIIKSFATEMTPNTTKHALGPRARKANRNLIINKKNRRTAKMRGSFAVLPLLKNVHAAQNK